MSSSRKMFWSSIAALGLMLGLTVTPVSALEKEKEKEKPAAKAEKIDVNTATAKEMEAELDGVGAVTAKKIVDGRPYKTIEDLVKAGVPQKTADKIAAHITFGKAEKADKADKEMKADKKEDKAMTKADKKDDKADKKDEVEAKVPPKKGMVWVNTESKIFHVEGDRWYGKTKKGEFMTEEDAVKAGARKAKD